MKINTEIMDKMRSEDFESLKEGQKLVFLGIAKKQNMLITGGGGVGKSHLIRFLSECMPDLVLTASTGIAAINIQGQTIDSFMGFNANISNAQEARNIDHQTEKRLSICKFLLIDEISMVRADRLDMIHHRFQAVKKNKLPFGGVQVVIVGDFCQLPPVVTNSVDDRSFKSTYGDRLFAFEAYCYEAANFTPYVLNEYVRQGDENTRKHLRNLRMGHKINEAIDFINTSSAGIIQENSLRICKTNRQVEMVNKHAFSLLDGDLAKVEGIIKGNFPRSSNAHPVDRVILLKLGARVMLSANNPNANYLNGDLGTVVYISHSHISVKLSRGPLIKVEPHEWKSYAYRSKGSALEKVENGSFIQLPIKLAFAITGHKAQGQTLDSASIDLSGSFNESGLSYVVLSRVRSLHNLKLEKPINIKDILTHPRAVKFTFKTSMEAIRRKEIDQLELSLI